jgi:hypothetical protein
MRACCYAYICKEKNYVFAEVLIPQKLLVPQIANRQIVTFAEGPQKGRKFADFQFEELI